MNTPVTFRIGRPTGETITTTTLRIERFLYDNFNIVSVSAGGEYGDYITVGGIEVAGFTRQAQLDRLASGLLFEVQP